VFIALYSSSQSRMASLTSLQRYPVWITIIPTKPMLDRLQCVTSAAAQLIYRVITSRLCCQRFSGLE